jgi:hypothetical protein
MDEAIKDVVKLGYAYGQARAACEYSGGVLETSEDPDQRKLAAISVMANKNAMNKTAEAFEVITSEE